MWVFPWTFKALCLLAPDIAGKAVPPPPLKYSMELVGCRNIGCLPLTGNEQAPKGSLGEGDVTKPGTLGCPINMHGEGPLLVPEPSW